MRAIHLWPTFMLGIRTPPIIGLTTYGQNENREFSLYADYVEAVRQANGLPILLPPGEMQPEAILQQIDGLILTGGGDIEPIHYQGSSHPTIYKVDSQRDASELTLARLALAMGLPILGICRGLQVLSIASGASLVAHVPDVYGTAIAHREAQRRPTRHRVAVETESRLFDIVGTAEMEIVSWHHQAVPQAPTGWRIAAHAADGVIEALEHESHPWAIALQWHPEMSLDDPLQQRIFRAFVSAAQSPERALSRNASEDAQCA